MGIIINRWSASIIKTLLWKLCCGIRKCNGVWVWIFIPPWTFVYRVPLIIFKQWHFITRMLPHYLRSDPVRVNARVTLMCLSQLHASRVIKCDMSLPTSWMRKRQKNLEELLLTQGKTLSFYALKPHNECIVLLKTWLCILSGSQ